MTRAEYEQYYNEKIKIATQEQIDFVTTLMAAGKFRKEERTQKQKIDARVQRLYFLTGDGGTGKSFSYNVVYHLFAFNYLFYYSCLLPD
jgi:hypothetical protein